jgi:predicted amidophosphoribosyltransferase
MNDVRSVFGEVAARYRRKQSRYQWPFAIGAVSVAAAFFLPKAQPYLLAAFLVSWVILLALSFDKPSAACPCCGKNLDSRIEEFCPECGAKDMKPTEIVSVPLCNSCKRELRTRRGHRVFSVKFCTRCGAHLDDVGI